MYCLCMAMKMLKLLFSQEKKERGSKLIIYANGTIALQSKTSKYAIHISSGLFRWKKLPKRRSDSELNVLVDFWYKEDKFEKVHCVIYHNNYECYIRPSGDEHQEESILQLMKKNATLKCVIPEKVDNIQQLTSTKYFNRALSITEQIILPDIEILNLITLGGMQKTKYEIFSDNEMNLFFRCSGKVDKKGVLVLSSEIARFIQDWFKKENLCLCSINSQPPLVLPLTNRRRNSTVKVYKELNTPYYGDPKRVTVFFSDLNSQLTEQVMKDFKLKSLLSGKGYNILALKSNLRVGNHYNKEFENQVRDFIEKAFRNEKDSMVLSEVELILTNNEIQLTGWDKNRFDSLIYHQGGISDYLALIEIKTSIESSNKSGIIESAIAKLYQLRKRISKKTIIPILVINEEVFYKGNLVTKDYGNLCNIILIGQNDLAELIKNPSKLHERLKQYLNSQNFKQSPIPTKLRTVNAISEGSDFENKIKQQLLIAGYKVQSNVIYRIQNKHMEIDHVATTQSEKILVSCKDHWKIKSEWKILSKLSEILNLIVLRKELLGFTKARLYVRIHPNLKDKITRILNSKGITEVDVFIE